MRSWRRPCRVASRRRHSPRPGPGLRRPRVSLRPHRGPKRHRGRWSSSRPRRLRRSRSSRSSRCRRCYRFRCCYRFRHRRHRTSASRWGRLDRSASRLPSRTRTHPRSSMSQVRCRPLRKRQEARGQPPKKLHQYGRASPLPHHESYEGEALRSRATGPIRRPFHSLDDRSTPNGSGEQAHDAREAGSRGARAPRATWLCPPPSWRRRESARVRHR